MSRKSHRTQAAPETPMKLGATTGANGPDVAQLAGESLSPGVFPAPRKAEFRVYFDPQVYAAMVAHACEDVSFEICGVLVGDLSRDGDGPFVNVRNYIRCDSAAKKFAEVTFTHESWAHINKEMDTKYQDQRIVGWYHSHPNFGIFLSDRDFFIQQNFFSGPGQVALVIDPVRKIEGVFEWRNGVTVPTPHYWVGSRMQLAPSGAGTEMPELSEANSMSAPSPSPVESLGMTTTLLAGLGLFLLGWLLADWRTRADREAIIEGKFAHFGLWKVVRPGLEDGLARLRAELSHTIADTKLFSEDHLKRAESVVASEKDEAKRAALQKSLDKLSEDWKRTRMTMGDMADELELLQQLYALTPEEQGAMARYILLKQMELQAAESSAREKSAKKSTEPAPADTEVKPKAQKQK